jgi:glycosidase
MRRLLVASLLIASCKHPPEPPPPPEARDAGAIADAGARPPAGGWWRDRVFYEIFVRSFQDSDGDGVGDLRGLTSRLDQLNDGDPQTRHDLGVTALWLMPIHPTPSYHGYDVVDYRAVNREYGTDADFDAFLAAAHARGMKVIIDLVLNHSSREHPWFIDARQQGPKRDWYLWRSADPGWKQPWGPNPVWHPEGGAFYYGLFWSGMPDLNLGNPAVEAEMTDVMKHWLRRGVDGFRVDAVRHLFESADGVLVDQPESHAFSKRLRSALEAEHPEVLLVAEAWTSMATVARYYGDADEYHLAFGFDTASALKTAAKDGLRASVIQSLAEAESSYADRGFEAPFLANHDMARTQRELGDAGAMRAAAIALLGLPGTPFLYYGEEIGMVGCATPRDEDKRTPMRWDATGPGFGFTTGRPWHTATEAAGVDVATQAADPASLRSLFRDLIAARAGHPALSRGGASRPAVSGAGKGVAVWLREHDGARALCAVNFAAEASPAFSVTLAGAPRVLFAEGLGGEIRSSGPTLELPAIAARGGVYLALE